MKRIVPIIVTIIICGYTAFYAFGLFMVALTEGSFFVKVLTFLIGLIPVGVIIAMLFTLKERLKEIKEEDKDDLSKY